MDTLTLILIILVVVFLIGNFLLSFVIIKKQKQFNYSSNDAKFDILQSKIELLNKRITLLEEKNNKLKIKKEL